MITLFVSDIDGCLAEPYAPYDLDTLRVLARRIGEGGGPVEAGAWPAFTICSGRPYGYVEAMTQVLGVRTPALFESGGGLFDPVAARTRWHPHFTDAVAEKIAAVRRWLGADCLPGTALKLDHEKRTQAGLVGPDTEAVLRLLPVVRDFVADRMPEMQVFHTEVSIDVVDPAITKREGLIWLAEILDLSLHEIAYIGDTNGDLVALEAVGFSFAPSNATEDVRRRVDRVMEAPAARGTLDAYRWCARRNAARLPQAV